MDFSCFNYLEDACALVQPDNVKVDFANAAFWLWTGQDEVKTDLFLTDLFKLIDLTKLKEKLNQGHPYSFEVDATPKQGRKFPVEYTIRSVQVSDKPLLVLHGRSISRIKEKELMLKSFSSVIEVNNRKLKQQKQQVQDLLDNMQQAVFAVNSEGQIIDPVSKYSSSLLKQDLSKTNVFDTLFRNINSKSEQYSIIKTAFVSCFGEDELQWSLVEDNIPKRVNYLAPEYDAFPPQKQTEVLKVLKVASSPIWNDEQKLERILFVVEDLTELERLEKEIAQERESNVRNVQIIQEMADLDKESVENFLTSSSKLLSESKNIARQLVRSQLGLPELFRNIHTLKGNARAFKFSLIAAVTHKVESEIIEIRDRMEKQSGFTTDSQGAILKGLDEIRSQLLEYSNFGKRIFGIEDEFYTSLIADIQAMVGNLDASLTTLLGDLQIAQWRGSASEDEQKEIVSQLIKKLMHPVSLLRATQESIENIEIPDSNRAEVKRIAHTLRSTTRLAHTMKGVSRGTGDHTLPDVITQIEQGLSILEDSKRINIENLKIELLDPLEELKQITSKLYFNSSLSSDFTLERETWLPIFLGTSHLSLLIDKLALTPNQEIASKAAEICHTLTAHCSAARADYLVHVYSRLEVISSEGRVLDASVFIRQAWKWLSFFSVLECNHKLTLEQRKRAVDLLYEASQCESADVKLTLFQELSTYDSIFIHSIMNHDQLGVPLSEILAALSQIQDCGLTELLLRFVSVEKSAADLTVLEQVLSRSKNEFEVLTELANFASDGLSLANHLRSVLDFSVANSTLGISSYLRKLDFLRLVRSYRTKDERNIEERLPKLISVIEGNYNQLLEFSQVNPLADQTLQDKLDRLMDLPVGIVFSRFKLMVADISRSLGKNVHFRFSGQSVRFKRQKLYLLQDALLHMLRNSLDHGVEKAQDRIVLGKPDFAVVELHFEENNNSGIKVVVHDNGRGINIDKVAEKAVLKGLVSAEKVLKSTIAEKLDLIFLPGLSTSDAVTQLSGRGVGMDVVKTTVEKLGGAIQVETKLGEETTFTILLPR